MKLVISHAQACLKAAIARVLQGAASSAAGLIGCPTRSRPSRRHAEMVAALVRCLRADRRQDHPRQLRQVVESLERNLATAAELLAEADHQRRRLRGLPTLALRKLVHRPAERVNKEIKRRTNVVASSPNDASVIRLVRAVLADVHDDWQVTDRRYLSEYSIGPRHPSTDRGDDTTAPTNFRLHRVPDIAGVTPNSTEPRDVIVSLAAGSSPSLG